MQAPDPLAPEQLDAVLRRAGELQQRSARPMNRVDILSISQELGIDVRQVEQAIGEVKSRRSGIDPYQIVLGAILGAGFLFVLIEIYKTFLGAL